MIKTRRNPLEVRMTNVHVLMLAFVMAAGVSPRAAQELFRYREYALGASVASVVTASGARETDAKTIHARPAHIQTLDWRRPYIVPAGTVADPVRDVAFSFYDDQLYRIVVTYDRARMEGLTNDDVIATLAAIYGTPARPATGTTRRAVPDDLAWDTTIVAKWENATSLVVLTRNTSLPLFQLVLTSKTTSALARTAVTESLRLDAREAPQRELDRQKKETDDAARAATSAREVNKGAFRP
jgi:hypothetical protein